MATFQVTYIAINGESKTDTFNASNYHIKDGWVYMNNHMGYPIASVREAEVLRIDQTVG